VAKNLLGKRPDGYGSGGVLTMTGSSRQIVGRNLETTMSSMTVNAGAFSTIQQYNTSTTTTRQSPIAAVASTLGLSTEDITTQLQQGKSLNDIATAQGVSHDALISALTAGMPSQVQSSDNATGIAEKIAGTAGLSGTQATQATSGTGAAQGHHHHHHHGSGSGAAAQVSSLDGSSTGVLSGTLTDSQQQTLDSLSSLLGTDSSSLLTSLQSGNSLADMVSSSGVDSSSLAAVLQDGLLVDTQS